MSDSQPLNAICPYYTMFPVELPLRHLRSASKGDWVIDPFCGRGSTNFAARALGLASVGVDSNPVAVAIAKAKLVSTTAEQVIASCRKILAEEAEAHDAPTGEFWQACFHPTTLKQLCTLRSALLRDCRSASRTALRALVLGRLHGPVAKGKPTYLSNQMPRTYASKPAYAVRFWAARGMKPPAVDVLDLVTRKASYYFDNIPADAGGVVVRGDSREVDLSRYVSGARWVVTSPPYYGMRTYVPDQWLRYWFLGGPSAVPYQFRGQLSHRSPEIFAGDLAKVWKNLAAVCDGGASMKIRFGGIHDRDASPVDLIRDSLRDSGWLLLTRRSAGSAAPGRRQAEQFQKDDVRQPIEEHDYYARLAV